MVVLEAMATGLPVVCLDFGGPGQMVSDEQGIKVGIGNRAEMVDGLSEALFQILQDSKWFEVSQREGIRQTIRSRFSWTAKEQFVANLYDNAVSRSTSDFR
jgi:glycosyltransferase involved in cell wall biosynthesis